MEDMAYVEDLVPPTIQVSVPPTAISGDYTATITHSVS